MIIKKKAGGVYLRDRNSTKYESNYFAGIEIKPGESFVDVLCRTIPARQRALSGLSIKMAALKMSEVNGEHIDENEKINVENELNRLRSMTDEEYDLEELRSNGVNVGIKHNVDEENDTLLKEFEKIGVPLKNKEGHYRSTYDVLKDIAYGW